MNLITFKAIRTKNVLKCFVIQENKPKFTGYCECTSNQ